MLFKPLNDNVIAQPELAKDKTTSGILLGKASEREQPRLAKVIAVGPDVKNVLVGDRILFQAFATSDLKVKDELYIALKEEFIIASVAPEGES